MERGLSDQDENIDNVRRTIDGDGDRPGTQFTHLILL